MKKCPKNDPLIVLLADDDKDDRFFFAKALESISIKTVLITVTDGERLLDHLLKNSEKLPDVLFLDLNMPRKNGSECLEEIKTNKKLLQLPVVIYSTSLNNNIADVLYQKGAHFYLRKTGLNELTDLLENTLTSMIKNKFLRPEREDFILNSAENLSTMNP
jgi:CheY-like chemotaxis protein